MTTCTHEMIEAGLQSLRDYSAWPPHTVEAVFSAMYAKMPKREPVIGELYCHPIGHRFYACLNSSLFGRIDIEGFDTEAKALAFIESCRPKDEGSDAVDARRYRKLKAWHDNDDYEVMVFRDVSQDEPVEDLDAFCDAALKQSGRRE